MRFPPELVHHILAHVDAYPDLVRCRRVCKDFKEAADRRILKTRFPLNASRLFFLEHLRDIHVFPLNSQELLEVRRYANPPPRLVECLASIVRLAGVRFLGEADWKATREALNHPMVISWFNCMSRMRIGALFRRPTYDALLGKAELPVEQPDPERLRELVGVHQVLAFFVTVCARIREAAMEHERQQLYATIEGSSPKRYISGRKNRRVSRMHFWQKWYTRWLKDRHESTNGAPPKLAATPETHARQRMRELLPPSADYCPTYRPREPCAPDGILPPVYYKILETAHKYQIEAGVPKGLTSDFTKVYVLDDTKELFISGTRDQLGFRVHLPREADFAHVKAKVIGDGLLVSVRRAGDSH
jgi:hypothetical protein